MTRMERAIVLDMAPDEAWRIIGSFGDMSWHPAIAETQMRDGEGHTDRVVTLALNGKQAVERLTGTRPRGYSYASLSTPSPTRDYKSDLRVEDAGGKARVVWSCSFEPKGVSEAEAVAVLTRIYDTGLNALPGKLADAS